MTAPGLMEAPNTAISRTFARQQGLVYGCALLIAAMAVLCFVGTQAKAQESPAAPSIEGTWEGVLGGRLHLVVTISKASDGTLAGQLNSVDQGSTLPIEKATLDGNGVRFEVSRVGGVYEGKMNESGTEIAGSWTQNGVPAQPLSLKRSEGAKTQAANSAKSPEHTPKPLTVPLDVVIPIAPTAFKADGKWHLAYELHVSNLSRWDCELTRVDVIPGNGEQKALASFTGADLDGLMGHPGSIAGQKSKIPSGGLAVVYMWADFDNLSDVPASIRQRITVKVGDYPEGFAIDTPAIQVDRKPVAVIGAPLTGGDWQAGNGPSNASGHRRALIPIEGRAYISQRFAIDWVQLYPDGKTYQGDPADNKNYRAYGHEIRAVADGTVTETKDGIPQNIPSETSRAVPITLETVGGNHVIVDIGNGLYAFYAHMQPGTLRVKVGEQVRRGQVLGLLGNSGNSTEPHLHFDICNASSMLGCEGMPYAFGSFEVLGKGDGWKPSDPHEAAAKHEMEIPMEDEVVSFSSAP